MDRDMATSFTFTRAGTLHAEAERKLSQSVSEALSTAASGTTLLALCDDEGSITRRFVSSGDNARNRAFRFASSLNASSTPDEEPVDLNRLELRRLACQSLSERGSPALPHAVVAQNEGDDLALNQHPDLPPLLRADGALVSDTEHLA